MVLHFRLETALQYKDDDGEDWANVAPVGGLLKRLKPDFDPRTYGATKIPELIAKSAL